MASSPEPRLTSPPPSSPGRHYSNEPHTPDNNLRSRFLSNPRPGERSGDASPTSTTMSNFSRFAFPPAPLPISSNFGTPTRKVTIRADPSLVTCFDPSDKELYDLWAPQK